MARLRAIPKSQLVKDPRPGWYVLALCHTCQKVSCSTCSAKVRSAVILNAIPRIIGAWRSYRISSAETSPCTMRVIRAPSLNCLSRVVVNPKSALISKIETASISNHSVDFWIVHFPAQKLLNFCSLMVSNLSEKSPWTHALSESLLGKEKLFQDDLEEF